MRSALRLHRRLFCTSLQAIPAGSAYDEVSSNPEIQNVLIRLDITPERFSKLCRGVERIKKVPSQFLDPVQNPKILPTLDLLDGFEMNKSEQCKLVAAFPRIFFLTTDLVDSKLRWLSDRMGMDNEELKKVVVGYPHFLDSSIDNKLEAMLDIFQAQGFSVEDLKRVLLRSPWVMSLPVEGLWENAFQALEKLNLTRAQQVTSLAKAPLMMNSEHEQETGSKIIWLCEKVGIDQEMVVNRFVVAQADVLYGTSLEEMQACNRVVRKFGYSREERAQLVQRDLNTLGMRAGELREKLEFIHNVIHKKLNDPRHLWMNFEGKMMARVAYLIHKGRNIEGFTMKRMWSTNYPDFVNIIAETSLENYSEYCTWFEAFPKNEKIARIIQKRCSPESGD